MFAETVQEAPLLLQTPADAPSEVERVQLQVPQGGGQPLATQASPLMLQMPSDVLSVVEAQMQAPQTGQPPPGTVQAAPPLLQVPAVASSKTEGVQLQSPQTGQPPLGTVQTAPLLLQTPAVASSKTEGVQLQAPQTGQPPPGTVQAAPPLLQVPAVAPSEIEGVQLQVPQTGTTGQLFAATVQRRDEPVQEAPPHPADTAWLLDCVPALDASVVDGVQLQSPQDPHWQSRGCVPLASLCSVSSQLPVLQPALQSLVLVWVKAVSQACVEGSGDHADQGAVPQTIRFTQYCVPVAPRLVEQSPVLQPALQVLVWVKDWPEQTVEVAGDHEAVPQLTGATGFSAEHTPEFDPPLLPSQRHW